MQAVQQQQQAQAQAQQPPGAAAPPPPAGLLPALADTPLTPTDMEAVKVGDLPKVSAEPSRGGGKRVTYRYLLSNERGAKPRRAPESPKPRSPKPAQTAPELLTDTY